MNPDFSNVSPNAFEKYLNKPNALEVFLGVIGAIILGFVFVFGFTLVWTWLVFIPAVHLVFHVTLPYWATVGLWMSACSLFACARSTTK